MVSGWRAATQSSLLIGRGFRLLRQLTAGYVNIINLSTVIRYSPAFVANGDREAVSKFNLSA